MHFETHYLDNVSFPSVIFSDLVCSMVSFGCFSSFLAILFSDHSSGDSLIATMESDVAEHSLANLTLADLDDDA